MTRPHPCDETEFSRTFSTRIHFSCKSVVRQEGSQRQTVRQLETDKKADRDRQEGSLRLTRRQIGQAGRRLKTDSKAVWHRQEGS